MNLLTQSAQPCRCLYFVAITTAYSWAWERNIFCWVFLQLVDKVDIITPMGRRSWNWRIWFGGVQLKYDTGTEGSWPWKVLLRLLSIYWTQMLWDSGLITCLALVYSALQSSPRRSTDVGQWNGWRWYHSPFWSLINILSLRTFCSYPSTSPLTVYPWASSICAQNSCPMIGILNSSDAAQSEVNLILLHTPQTWVPLTCCTCCDMGQKNGLPWQCGRRTWWARRVCLHLSAPDTSWRMLPKSILYQPHRESYERVSSI